MNPINYQRLRGNWATERRFRPGRATTECRLSRRGIGAELVASRWELGRAEVDTYAQQSRWRVRQVAAMGEFGPEIIPAVVSSPESRVLVEVDETIADVVSPGSAHAVLECTGIEPDELDPHEISEAFPSIPLAWQLEFDADINRLNPRGGSIGLGRPGPASGLRSLATTLSALEATGGRLGIQVSEGVGSAGDALFARVAGSGRCPSSRIRSTALSGPNQSSHR